MGLGAGLEGCERCSDEICQVYGVEHTILNENTPRGTLEQGFAVVAQRSVGAGWCAGEDGCGRNIRDARPETRGWLPNALVVMRLNLPT